MDTFKSLFMVLIFLIYGPVALSQESTMNEVLTVAEMKDVLSENQEILLLDVRTEEEYKEGHLPEAKNIDFLSDDFQQKVADLSRDEPVYLYCRSGNRSEKAASLLESMGFKEIYDLEGGYQSWAAQKQEN